MAAIVVTGPPCSGKSTYVQDHAKPGDITIDFDALATALGSSSSHGHDPLVWNLTLRVHRVATELALALAAKTTVWIVDGQISPDSAALYRQHRAEIVTMTVGRQELHRRASAAGRPKIWHRLIDQWAADLPAVSGSREW